MASSAQICGFLLLPERTDALTAVSLTIGRIRKRYGISAKEIAKSLKQPNGEAPSPDTIERAERMENLLALDLTAQLACLFEDCADPIRRLMEPAARAEPITLEERLQRAEQEILAVRRELAGAESEAA